MRYVMFSKLVRELSIPRLIETLKEIGAEGVDLCVRDGYPVNPGNVRDELPKAVQQFRSAGLVVTHVTASTDLTNPASPVAEAIFRACHDAGVRDIKVGYWAYKPGGYWREVDSARKDAEGFVALATRYGLRACFHTHSGNNLGLNTSSLMHVLRGLQPAHAGAYLDPGHLALCGEPPAMAVDIASEHLALVALKDSLWERGANGQPRRSHFVPIGDGMVEWKAWLRALIARGYDGPLSFHSEYEGMSTAQILEQTRKDIQYIRRVEAEARKA